MKVAFLQLDLGGTLRHTMVSVPSDGSRWDSSPAPAVVLYGPGGGEIRASTAATLGASHTLSSAVSSGSSILPVSSSTGFERYRDVVIGPNALGQWEWGTIDGLGATVHLLDPLQYDYATSAQVQSHDLETIVTSADVGSVEHNCRAEWRYSVGSIPRRESTVFSVSRYAPRHGLNAADVAQEDPRVSEVIGSGQRVDLLIERLWERKVLPDIATLWRPGATVSGSDCDEALMAKVQETVARLARDFEAADHYREVYRAALDGLRQSLIDLDQDGSQDDTEVPQGTHTIRMLRG